MYIPTKMFKEGYLIQVCPLFMSILILCLFNTNKKTIKKAVIMIRWEY